MALRFQTYSGIDAATGFGRFSIRIEPPSSIKVVVKVFFASPVGAGNLTPVKIDNFFNEWQQKVSNVWDNKFRFRLIATNEVVTCRFLLHRVGDIANCDFPVWMTTGYAQHSGVKFPSPGVFGGTRIYLQMGEDDNTPWFLANATNVVGGQVGTNQRTLLLATERQRVIGSVANVVNDRFTVQLQRTPAGAWTVPLATQTTLNAFCNAIAATPGVAPQPPVTVYVSSGLTDKMKVLAATTVNYLRGHGVMGQIKTEFVQTGKRFRLPFSDHSTTADVDIGVQPVSEMMKQWRSEYLVSAHEFGHLLGLPDEYLDYSTFTNLVIKQSQPKWDALCDRHVPAIGKRNWRSAFNDSIMSIDRTVYKAHAVTIWEALERSTGGIARKSVESSNSRVTHSTTPFSA